MNDNQNFGDTPFNMAMLFYMALNKLWESKDQAIIEGDLMKWYNCLKAIHIRISFKIKKNDKINDKFESCLKLIQEMPLENIKDVMDSEAAKILNKIDIQLIDILNKKSMIFPNINVVHGFDKINKRYNLDGPGG